MKRDLEAEDSLKDQTIQLPHRSADNDLKRWKPD